ncbi:DUF6804 family protein [Lacinutrix chionoecetis]
MEKLIKVILTILLLLCLLNMPYGFYELVRFLALVGFGYLAFDAYKKENKIQAFVYIALAILFQPLFKIALGRELWNIVDVIVAIGLIISSFVKPKSK